MSVAKRYEALVTSSDYRSEVNLPRQEWEEKRGRPRASSQVPQEHFPSCVNVAGVRLTPANRKKILGAIALFPSVVADKYKFDLSPRKLFATAKELGFRYNVKVGVWEQLEEF